MAKAIRYYQFGPPDVLRWEAVPVGRPGPGEVRVRHEAVGLNFADTYFRSGRCPTQLPAGMGVEAAGVIEAVGPDVRGFAEGDRVTYAGSPLGAYSTERVMDTAPLIKLPDRIEAKTAAAMTVRGLTVAYLLTRICPLRSGDTVLLHAAAGGVGLIFLQWARLLGVNVIGTVSTDSKAAIARAHGCTHTIVYTRENVPERVRELTDGVGVPVVYDGVGKTTHRWSLDSLARRGLLICFGTSSGPIPPIDAMELVSKGSLFVARPVLTDYIADPGERAMLAGQLFGHVLAGRITVEIGQRYPLEDAVQAHRDLESRRTVGSSVFCLLVSEREVPMQSTAATATTATTAMNVVRLTASIGAEVCGVDLGAVARSAELFAEFKSLLLAHKVLFLRDQDITRAEHVQLARRFGPLEDHPVAPSDPENPGLVRIYKDEDSPAEHYENAYHCDGTWQQTPPMGCVLRCVQSPAVGGDTIWVNMALAYAGLPEHVKTQIGGLSARHSIEATFGAAMPAGQRLKLKERFPDAEHPVVRTHPETGERVLFVNGFTTHFVNFHTPRNVRHGIDFSPGASHLLNYLISQATIPDYQVRWRWTNNSFAIWDNRCTQHYAVQDYWPAVRKMERAAIVGDKPF